MLCFLSDSFLILSFGFIALGYLEMISRSSHLEWLDSSLHLARYRGATHLDVGGTYPRGSLLAQTIR